MKDLDTRVVVQVTDRSKSSHQITDFSQNFDTGVKTTRGAELGSLTCSDLLTAYRLSQSLNRNRHRPYKYDPAETMDLHRWNIQLVIVLIILIVFTVRRLTINSRIIFDKLSSPRKERKSPYVPNRDIMRLFSTSTEDRGRERLVLENEEYLYNSKTTYDREGQFFQPKNPEIIEKFQSTHEYIKKLYEHSKSN